MDWKYINLFLCLNLQISLCCIPALSNKPTTTTLPPVKQTTTTTALATEDLCRTEGSPNPDEPCIFPFNYNGRDYNECESFNGRYWCGLQYTYSNDRWGYCKEADCPPTKEIPEEETTKTTTTTFSPVTTKPVTTTPETTTPETTTPVTTTPETTTPVTTTPETTSPETTTPETTTPVTTTPVTTAPVTEVERGITNLTVRDGEQGYFCDIEFDYKMDQTFQLITDLMVDCNPSSNLKDSKSFLELNKFQIQTSKGVDLDCSLNAIFSNDKPGSIEVPEKAVEKSLSCNASTEVCLTNDGPVYPAKCAQTFRYEGREYHGCTDKEMEEIDERLWCATLVDGDTNAVSGHWGYCSSKCSFCAGSPITRQIQSRPCGYDCLVNPGKPMKGSIGSTDVPLLSPSASIVGKKEANFIKEVRGQIQLYTGEQLVRLSCPNSKFFDTDLKGSKTVYAICGPTQYRFTVYAVNGDLLHKEYKNDRFGCDPCPPSYIFIPGYVSSTDDRHISTSDNIENIDLCEDMCYNSAHCSSLTFSQNGQTCNLFSDIILEATYSQHEDIAICSIDPECCEDIKISSTGGTSQFQLSRLGTFSRFGYFNNRAAYEQVSGSKILYYAGYQEYGWVVSSGFDSLGGLRSPSRRDSLCPSDEFSWEYFSGNSWINDTSVVVSCQRGLVERALRLSKNQIKKNVKLLGTNWGAYVKQREILQGMAHILLLESIRLDKHFQLPLLPFYSERNLPFYKSILKETDKNLNEETYVWLLCKQDCKQDGVLGDNEKVFNIPSEDRLRFIVNEIGYLMVLYGMINQDSFRDNKEKMNRKLFKVDNFLYEMGMTMKGRADKRGLSNLYIAPLACYYSKEGSKEGSLTMEQCEGIKKKYGAVNDLKYTTIMSHLTTIETKLPDNGIVYAALRKLFMKESIQSPEKAIQEFYTSFYTSEDQNFKAFMAEVVTFAIVAETIRNIEMLPVLFALISLNDAGLTDNTKSIKEIHPMMGDKTFYTNHLEYELGISRFRMKSVGFFPIFDTMTDSVEQQYRPYISEKDTIRAYLAGMWNVHYKAMDIMERIEKVMENEESLLTTFFNTGELGLNMPVGGIPKEEILSFVFTAQNKNRPTGN